MACGCFAEALGYTCKYKTFSALKCAGLRQTQALLILHSHRHQTGCMATLWEEHVPQTWAAPYTTGLLIKLTPKGVVFSFFPFSVPQMMGTEIAGVGQTQTRAAPGIRVPGGRPGYPAGTVCRGCMCSARPASDGLTSLTSPSTTAHALLAWRMAWPTATSTPLYRWAHPTPLTMITIISWFFFPYFLGYRGIVHP
jgi:hypothetical protein